MKKYLKNYLTLPHFKDYFQSQNYNDGFGCWPVWNQEIEKWLANAEVINKNHYFKQKNRIKAQKQRDELLGEYKAIYFISKKLKLRVLKIEPRLLNGHRNDFLFKDKANINWHVEVKTPSWQAEVFNDTNLSLVEKIARKNKPQFINAEGHAVSVQEAVEFSVKHSLNQFEPNNNNLLLICPNMFSDLVFLSSIEKHYKLKTILSLLDKTKLIHSICLLEPIILSKDNEVKYNFEFVELTKSIKI
jgi:hypothetical protein